MPISINPISNNYFNKVSFGAKNQTTASKTSVEERNSHILKTKKAIAALSTVATIAGILYFGVKHNLKINAQKNQMENQKKLEELKAPIIALLEENKDSFIGVV